MSDEVIALSCDWLEKTALMMQMILDRRWAQWRLKAFSSQIALMILKGSGEMMSLVFSSFLLLELLMIRNIPLPSRVAVQYLPT